MSTVSNARVLADSVTEFGDRVTTLEVTHARSILAELNTHRVFSRNGASSRAVPYPKTRDRVLNDPFIPSFRSEQKGMQGGGEIVSLKQARVEWLLTRNEAVKGADRLHQLGVHKTQLNRLLEPFMWQTTIITGSNFDSFFEQRCHPDADDPIRWAAEAMQTAYNSSTPRVVLHGGWHLPLIHQEDIELLHPVGLTSEREIDWATLCKISAARCARVSYLTHGGVRDHNKDLELYKRLTTHRPGHWSPLEHVATPASLNEWNRGNLSGWHQLRHIVEYAIV